MPFESSWNWSYLIVPQLSSESATIWFTNARSCIAHRAHAHIRMHTRRRGGAGRTQRRARTQAVRCVAHARLLVGELELEALLERAGRGGIADEARELVRCTGYGSARNPKVAITHTRYMLRTTTTGDRVRAADGAGAHGSAAWDGG